LVLTEFYGLLVIKIIPNMEGTSIDGITSPIRLISGLESADLTEKEFLLTLKEMLGS
jgi:hypothetical protein